LSETEFPEDIYLRIRAMAEEEIKMIEANYSNGNYIMMHKKKKKDGHLSVQTKKIPESEKKDKIKDNKVMMLQQLMQHNFTHGKIKGQVT